jgi:predicted  nucleic acid-binding Zn-ribbon protein
MKKCKNCGASVSSKFARVFGNDEDEVFECPTCASFSALVRGRAAKSER